MSRKRCPPTDEQHLLKNEFDNLTLNSNIKLGRIKSLLGHVCTVAFKFQIQSLAHYMDGSHIFALGTKIKLECFIRKKINCK